MARQVFGMVSSYKGLTQHDWLWKQTPQPFGVWGNAQILANEAKPDFLLMYQFNFKTHYRRPPQSWKQKVSGVMGRNAPPTVQDFSDVLRGTSKARTVFLLREPPLPEVLATNKINYGFAQKYCDYVSGPDEFAPQPDYMPAIWYVNQPFDVLDKGPVPQKHKPCSWIMSGINRTQNHRDRLSFLQSMQEYAVEFDLYGRGLPAWSHPKGELSNKWHGMAPYYYNLAIENYVDNDLYVSEKLWDALLSWCLPIYYGGSAADRLLPPGSFVRLPSLDEAGMAFIKEVTASPDAWYEAKDAIAEARQVILHRLNLLNWLSDYADQHT